MLGVGCESNGETVTGAMTGACFVVSILTSRVSLHFKTTIPFSSSLEIISPRLSLA